MLIPKSFSPLKELQVILHPTLKELFNKDGALYFMARKNIWDSIGQKSV
jgi:hypothetical protein